MFGVRLLVTFKTWILISLRKGDYIFDTKRRLPGQNCGQIYNFTANCSPDVYLTPPTTTKLKFFCGLEIWLHQTTPPPIPRICPSHRELRYFGGLQISLHQTTATPRRIGPFRGELCRDCTRRLMFRLCCYSCSFCSLLQIYIYVINHIPLLFHTRIFLPRLLLTSTSWDRKAERKTQQLKLLRVHHIQPSSSKKLHHATTRCRNGRSWWQTSVRFMP